VYSALDGAREGGMSVNGAYYSSKYEDYGSQVRYRVWRACGHYPLITGSPCAGCIDAALNEALQVGYDMAQRGEPRPSTPAEFEHPLQHG
jgi:hypothetical protein